MKKLVIINSQETIPLKEVDGYSVIGVQQGGMDSKYVIGSCDGFYRIFNFYSDCCFGYKNNDLHKLCEEMMEAGFTIFSFSSFKERFQWLGED